MPPSLRLGFALAGLTTGCFVSGCSDAQLTWESNGKPSKVEFYSVNIFAANSCSGPFQVALEDVNGIAVNNVSGSTWTFPIAQSGTGAFYAGSDSTCSGATISELSFPNGSSTASFYIYDTVVPSPLRFVLDASSVNFGTKTLSLVNCTRTVTSSLSMTSPFTFATLLNYSIIGGGGGGGGSGAGTAGANAVAVNGTTSLSASTSLVVYVGGGGGGSVEYGLGNGGGGGGGGGSGYYGGGGAGGTGNGFYSSAGGGGGSSAILVGGVAAAVAAGGAGGQVNNSGFITPGGSGGGSSGGAGSNGLSSGYAVFYWAGTDGALNAGGNGGASTVAYTGYGGSGASGGQGGNASGSGGSSGADGSGAANGGGGGGGYGGGGQAVSGGINGVGANTWSANTTLPVVAGKGGSPITGNGGNAGLVIFSYAGTSCVF